MKLALQLSCYNGAKYLPYLFDSLKKQTYTDWHLYVLDNASDADNEAQIKQAVEQSGLPISLYRVHPNIGFAGAHIYLFEKHKHESGAVQLLNDDAILEPDYLEKCLAYLEAHPNCAAVEGKVLRWNFDEREAPNGGKTDIIDSLGLEFDWKGFFKDRGMGEKNSKFEIRNSKSSIVGVSGCLPMYRVDAARKVSMEDTLFDPSYRIYKEDCDLALRLQAAGYTAAIVPDAVAYHRRNLGMKSFSGQSLSRAINENTICSYRNHLWLLIAHLTPLSFITRRIGVLPFEFAKFAYWLVRSPKVVWSVIHDTKREWSHLMRKRSFIQHLRHAGTRLRDTNRPRMPYADIAIIMVSHNDLSEDCLRSLDEARRRTTHSTALVVVDNDSHKFHANEFVNRFFPHTDAWTLLRNDDFGYGRSMNRGAKQVDAKYYFILNPDTVLIDPDIFNAFYDYMEANPDVGLAAPKILSFNGELQDTCRRFPTWYQPLIQRTSLKQTDFGKRYTAHFLMKEYDHASERGVDWVQGSAMFVRGDLWKQLRGFDDRYWLYFEDIDLCRRTWLAGKKVMYLPQITLKHAHGRQSAQITNFVLNFIKVKETRGHIASWMKYLLKWNVGAPLAGVQSGQPSRAGARPAPTDE